VKKMLPRHHASNGYPRGKSEYKETYSISPHRYTQFSERINKFQSDADGLAHIDSSPDQRLEPSAADGNFSCDLPSY